MVRRTSSIDVLANVTARLAQSESAMVQHDLRALRDSMAGLHQVVKAPQPRKGSRIIKGSRSSPSLLENLVGYVVQDALGAVGGYRSAAQNAGSVLANIALGQRIR